MTSVLAAMNSAAAALAPTRRAASRARRRAAAWSSAASSILVACGSAPPAPGTTSAPDTAAIEVDQVGYLPDGAKWAAVREGSAAGFAVIDEATGHEAWRGTLSAPRRWEPAQETLRLADFSALRRPGHYRLKVDGLAPSVPFAIDSGVYAALNAAAIKAQRVDLPESGNGVPDRLDEVLWNLDWMLAMHRDDCKQPYPSEAPAKDHLDAFCSFTTNEIAINWNAPLVYVSAALQVLTTPQCLSRGPDFKPETTR